MIREFVHFIAKSIRDLWANHWCCLGEVHDGDHKCSCGYTWPQDDLK